MGFFLRAHFEDLICSGDGFLLMGGPFNGTGLAESGGEWASEEGRTCSDARCSETLLPLSLSPALSLKSLDGPDKGGG